MSARAGNGGSYYMVTYNTAHTGTLTADTYLTARICIGGGTIGGDAIGGGAIGGGAIGP